MENIELVLSVENKFYNFLSNLDAISLIGVPAICIELIYEILKIKCSNIKYDFVFIDREEATKQFIKIFNFMHWRWLPNKYSNKLHMPTGEEVSNILLDMYTDLISTGNPNCSIGKLLVECVSNEGLITYRLTPDAENEFKQILDIINS